MADDHSVITYEPLNTLKSVADDVWIVDGPVIRFGMPWPKMPFPTRMTIVRIGKSDLFIHSPTRLTEDLKAEIGELGAAALDHRAEPYPLLVDARVEGGLPRGGSLSGAARQRAGGRPHRFSLFRFGSRARLSLGRANRDASGHRQLHDGSRVPRIGRAERCSLADLIENFEPDKIPFWMRWLVWLGGCLDPNGGTPRDMRLTFAKQKSRFRTAVETMIAWNPERIILAHGRWYDKDGARELRRAFRWVLN